MEGALAVLRRSGALIMWIGGGRSVYEMTLEAKASLLEGYPLPLGDNTDFIERMSREIDKKLAVN